MLDIAMLHFKGSGKRHTPIRVSALPIVLCLFILCESLLAWAQAPPLEPLPVKSVTLFTSGVACMERGGTITGNAAVPLMFHTDQINDILKSMVLIDRGGKVQPATFASQDPIGKTLQSFAIDVSEDLSQVDLLSKLRGARVSVEGAGAPAVAGQVIGVDERQTGGTAEKPINAVFMNILTDAGLTAVRIEPGKTVRIEDERLDHDLREALKTLASGSDNQRRQVTLHFAGNGARQVRVAYVTEAPLWKMSYRLVLAANAKPYLQGWAIVENTTDEDWKGIRLSLVSGRPVSFIQDLYQPLYIPRPVVGPDVVASPNPQTHGENLQEQIPAIAKVPAVPNTAFSRPSQGGGRGGQGGFGQARGLLPNGVAPNDITALSNNNVIVTKYGDDIAGAAAFKDVQRSLRAQASGARAGEAFKYQLTSPIDLPRLQAAMIPVVTAEVAADHVSLYNPEIDPQFPMNALRLRNNTKLQLKSGPLTLFDEGVYAGDARLPDMPPSDSNLISYAVDLDLQCKHDAPTRALVQETLAVRRGVFVQTRRVRYDQIYTLRSRTDRQKKVLVEQPIESGVHLVSPAAPSERTERYYRFRVSVPPRTTQTLHVVTEQPISTRFGIESLSSDRLFSYMSNSTLSARLRSALQEVVRRRRQIADLKAQAGSVDSDISVIVDDQDRIRKNMAALEKSSNLYRRYTGELDGQETRIQALRVRSAALNKEAAHQENLLHAYTDGISE